MCYKLFWKFFNQFNFFFFQVWFQNARAKWRRNITTKDGKIVQGAGSGETGSENGNPLSHEEVSGENGGEYVPESPAVSQPPMSPDDNSNGGPASHMSYQQMFWHLSVSGTMYGRSGGGDDDPNPQNHQLHSTSVADSLSMINSMMIPPPGSNTNSSSLLLDPASKLSSPGPLAYPSYLSNTGGTCFPSNGPPFENPPHIDTNPALWRRALYSSCNPAMLKSMPEERENAQSNSIGCPSDSLNTSKSGFVSSSMKLIYENNFQNSPPMSYHDTEVYHSSSGTSEPPRHPLYQGQELNSPLPPDNSAVRMTVKQEIQGSDPIDYSVKTDKIQLKIKAEIESKNNNNSLTEVIVKQEKDNSLYDATKTKEEKIMDNYENFWWFL